MGAFQSSSSDLPDRNFGQEKDYSLPAKPQAGGKIDKLSKRKSAWRFVRRRSSNGGKKRSSGKSKLIGDKAELRTIALPCTFSPSEDSDDTVNSPAAILASRRSTPQGLRQVLLQRSQSMSALWARNASAQHSFDSEESCSIYDEEDEDQFDDHAHQSLNQERHESSNSHGPGSQTDDTCGTIEADKGQNNCQDNTRDESIRNNATPLTWNALKSIAGPIGVAAPPPPQKPCLPQRLAKHSSSRLSSRRSIKRMMSLPVDISTKID